MPKLINALVLFGVFFKIDCLDNGLALTPPMGWLQWERFRCLTNCTLYPDECISEKLFKDMADRMAADGYLEAGYEYVIMDDCWLSPERDSSGWLQPDPERFPSGIKALADYVHSKGLKFGIYADYGSQTCAGYPGSLGYLETDANTFADWGVDYLKMDGCNAKADVKMEMGHLQMAKFLNETGRPIVFSCEFPLYFLYEGSRVNYTVATEACNLWRNFYDIEDSWSTVVDVIKFYKDNQQTFVPIAGPGHWNDPDMLIIGNYGLSFDQSIAQMTIWTIIAAPLLMSTDLRTIKPEFKNILLNKDAIAINQDPLGYQGFVLTTIDHIDVWIKPITPKSREEFSYALGFVSNRVDGYPFPLSFTLESLNIKNQDGYKLKNVFEPAKEKVVYPSELLQVRVKPTGAVLLRLNVVNEPKSEPTKPSETNTKSSTISSSELSTVPSTTPSTTTSTVPSTVSSTTPSTLPSNTPRTIPSTTPNTIPNVIPRCFITYF